MRKKVSALTAILVIGFLMQPITQMEVVKGNSIDTTPPLAIESPETYTNGKVYQQSSVDLIVDIHQVENSTEITAIFYSLDGNSNRTLSILYNNNIPYSAKGVMENLTNGYHFLEVYSLDAKGKSMSTSTPFLVNTSFSYPKLLLSPLNITYGKNEVSLIYTVNETAKYQIYYSLDNTSYPISSNTTLTGLSEGQHRIEVSAITHNGYLYSENTVYFEINTSETELPLGNYTIGILIIITILAIIAALLAILFHKRKRALVNSPHYLAKSSV